MNFKFSHNDNDIEYNDDDEYDSNDNSNNSFEKPNNKNNEFELQKEQNLGESISTLSSSNRLTNSNFEKYPISSNFDNKPSLEKLNKNQIKEQNNEIKNIEYEKLLNYIIDKGQIINSVIITENEKLLNLVTIKIINNNINLNKKICYLASEIKKAQNIYDLYKDFPKIKASLLQKTKGKKSKNDYQTFMKQINENNFFIVLPNVLYKLLSIGFIKIFDFGLIIFDECHLCDSNHPYNTIMQEFYFYYYVFYPNLINNLPKIIGFTNSPYKDKNIVKNNKKCAELLKNISENLNCQVVVDSAIFENNKNFEEETEFIEVESILKDKNKVDGINIILMKFFFENMLNLCLDDYIITKGENSELNLSNKDEIKNKYISTLKDKFNSETFEKYNSIETSERSLHFLSANSTMFHIFEDIQKHLFIIIQNLDLEEIYNFFEKYKDLYESNLKKQNNNDSTNKYLKKLYKQLIFIFKINIRAFKRLLDKNIEYKTDRLVKFISKLKEIYKNNKFSKILVFVPNRKIANIVFNYLNRDKKYNIFINKSKFIIGANAKKEENLTLSLATRITLYEIKDRIREFNENKINILICTPPVIEYLKNEKCDYILIFSELSNSSNDYEKVKQKAKNCNAKLIILGNDPNKIDDSLKQKKHKEFNQLKNFFMEEEKIINPKDFREKDFIKNKNINMNYYFNIEQTQAKMSLKNCMLLFNEINNLYLSKNIKINIKKNIIVHEMEQKFSCKIEFQKEGENPINISSNKYNDKQSAENECYLQYIIYLYKRQLIDDHFRVKI